MGRRWGEEEGKRWWEGNGGCGGRRRRMDGW